MYDERVTTRFTRLLLLFAMLFAASMPALAAFDVEKGALGEFCEGASGASDAEEHTYFVGESGAWVHNNPFCGITRFRVAADGAITRFGDDLVTVTHRGTRASIAAKVANGVLPANLPIPNTALVRALEHPRAAVWVSEGPPTAWNRLWSGMAFGRGPASVTFQVPRSAVKAPRGILKRIFGRSQRVIETDVLIPSNAVVRGL